MVIVAGHLVIEPQQRDAYVSGCVELLADPVPSLERWESQAAVDAFRGAGPSDEQSAAIRSASVAEYGIDGERTLM